MNKNGKEAIIFLRVLTKFLAPRSKIGMNFYGVFMNRYSPVFHLVHPIRADLKTKQKINFNFGVCGVEVV
jgi:hypothetical protein